MEPSRVRNESMHQARARVLRQAAHDPLVWVLMASVGVAVITLSNDGIDLVYDAEKSLWCLSSASMPTLPGSVSGFGFPAFAAALAAMAVLTGCRQELGRSARFCFLLVSSALAGIGAIVWFLLAFFGVAPFNSLISMLAGGPDCLGCAFGLYFVAGLIALCVCFERHWHSALLLVVFAIAGNALGLFLFAPPVVTLAFAGAAALTVPLVFFHLYREAPRSTTPFRLLVVLAVFLVLAALAAALMLPEEVLSARIAPWTTGSFLSKDFFSMRAILSKIASKVWFAHPWSGTGLGSFALDIRFNAMEDDWIVLLPGQMTALNAYWQLLAERGLVGAVLMASPFLLVLLTHGRRLCEAFRLGLPHPACFAGPFALAALLTAGMFDFAALHPAVVLPAVAILSISALSFRKGEAGV